MLIKIPLFLESNRDSQLGTPLGIWRVINKLPPNKSLVSLSPPPLSPFLAFSAQYREKRRRLPGSLPGRARRVPSRPVPQILQGAANPPLSD